jgi:hypothetical protein
VLAHREPAGSGFHGAVGVSVQTGAPQQNTPGAVSQNTADTVTEQMAQTEFNGSQNTRVENQEFRTSCIEVFIAVVVKTQIFWAVTLQLIAQD